MREVLAARSDRDFVAASPPVRGRHAPRVSGWGRLAGGLARHPGTVAGGAVFAAAAAFIALNALSFQTARHPAPLFGDKPDRVDMRPAPKRVSVEPPSGVPVPPARPLPVSTPAPAPVTLTTPAPAAKPASQRDALGDLIRGGGEATGAVSRSPDLKPEPQRLVLSAQRALVKLGYAPLTADGLIGPATRSALERFERDRRLPVTGELGARTVRELAAQSGIPLE